jgi:NADPH2:quinone reductase
MYPANPPLPHVLGRDGVGEVIAIGEGVKNVRVGDLAAVLRCDVGVSTWGTLAEKTSVCAASLTPIAERWTLEEMAGAPLGFLTAWQALTQWQDPPAPERSGSVLLVTGASGGVGVASILLGKSMGLTVVALSRSATKGARLKELGADFVFNPSDPGLRKAVLSAISPRKVDLVVDNIGGALFNEVIGMLGYAGRISAVGRSAGPVPELNTANLFFRRNRIGGVAVSDYSPEAAQVAWREIVRRVNDAGKRPVVDQVVPFEDVKQGFARLSEGPLGKVVVQVAG